MIARRSYGEASLTTLVNSVVGNVPLNKRPLLIADDLETQFMRQNWPEGMSLGGECALASRYGVGRDVLREVSRLLEARNHVRMRRGPKGGLEVVRPDIEDLSARLVGYAYLTDTDRNMAVDAWIVIQAVAARILGTRRDIEWPALVDGLRVAAVHGVRTCGDALISASGSPLLAILGGLVGGLLCTSVDTPLPASVLDGLCGVGDAASMLHWLRGAQHASLLQRLETLPAERIIASPPPPRTSCFQHQAMHLVHDLMTTIAPADWAGGRLIGNEFDLADRFSIDKSVVRQAIRLMEDAETATSLPGRGRGLVTRLPSTAPLSRLICAFLAAHHVDVPDAEQVFEAMRIETVGIAAKRATIEDRVSLLAMYNDLDELTAPLPVSAFQALERLHQHASHNHLLCLCIDGIKAFITWRLEPWSRASAAVVDAYRDHTQRVIDAVCAGDGDAAMMAETAKLTALRTMRGRRTTS